MRRVLPMILAMLFVFPLPAKCEEPLRRGLFVTVVQGPKVLSSRKEISRLVDFAKKARIETLFVQIYHANQAWFPSKIADQRPYEACSKSVSADPFKLLINEAHSAGIQVYAWLNMLSLSNNKDAKFLKKYGTDILTKNLREKKRIEDYLIDDQYFLEPGDLRVREELSKMVEEILRSYPSLDGVLFDYVRYPDENPAYGYTRMNVERFKKASGLKTIKESSRVWKEWKREQVTGVLRLLVKKTRALSPDIHISATGCMPYSRAYYEAFQDWPSWLDGGLVDSVTIMSYSPHPREFDEWVSTAKNKTKNFKKVNVGIGAYKLVRSPKLFEREFRLCENAGPSGCVIFHYGSLLENPALGNFLLSEKRQRESSFQKAIDSTLHPKGQMTRAVLRSADTAKEDEKILMDMGIACILNGKGDEAIAIFNKIIKANPANAAAYDNRAYAYVLEDDYLQALADYSKAIEIDPRDADAYYNRGLLYDMHVNDRSKAIADFNKALELNPDAGEAYLGRGVVYAKGGQYDKAMSDYNKAVRLNPKDGEIYYNRAVAYYYKYEYQKAMYDVKKAEELGFEVDRAFLIRLKKALGQGD